MILDPSALDAWLRLEFVTLVDRLLGLMFSRLKALRKLALISILAFSPITRILGSRDLRFGDGLDGRRKIGSTATVSIGTGGGSS